MGKFAAIIAEESDEKLKPYLVKLLEWLQDMNRPRAFCIRDRLLRYSGNDSIRNAINICIEKTKECNDETWECNLSALMQNRK